MAGNAQENNFLFFVLFSFVFFHCLSTRKGNSMENVFTPSRFVVQSDWELSVSNKSESFWAGFKKPGVPGVYCNFFPVNSDSGDKAHVEIASSDPNFSVTYNHKKRFLRISKPSDNYSATIFSPVASSGKLHEKNVYSMDVASGGLGVSSDSVGNLIIWESASFTIRRSLKGHFGDIYTSKFFPSGLVVLSGGADMQLKIWSVETGECARTLIGHKQAITDVGFIDLGRNVVSCSKDGTARLWDCGSGECLAKFETDGGGQVNGLSLANVSTALSNQSTDGSADELGTQNKLIALACETGILAGFALGTKSKVFQVRCDSAVNACEFCDEKTLVCGMENGCVSLLDLRKSSAFLHISREDRGAVWSIRHSGTGYWTSFGDGSVMYRPMEPSRGGCPSDLELSGPDCDPVYRVVTDGRHFYTCCRDAKIRKYLVE